MIDKDKMLELAQAEDYAYYKGDLVLSLPRGSNTTEEMWDILMESPRAEARGIRPGQESAIR